MRGRRELSQNWKKVLWIWGKNIIIIFIYGLNFHWKCWFMRVSRKILRNVSLCAPDQLFIKVPSFLETSPVLKHSLLRGSPSGCLKQMNSYFPSDLHITQKRSSDLKLFCRKATPQNVLHGRATLWLQSFRLQVLKFT